MSHVVLTVAGVTHLHSGLREVDLQCHLFPHEDVRVSRLEEKSFQYIELWPAEGCPLPPLLPCPDPCGTTRVAVSAFVVTT